MRLFDETIDSLRSCSPSSCGFGGVCSALISSKIYQTTHSSSLIECLCPHQCSGSLLVPVCGSDGSLYRNQCHLNLESCRFQREIHVQPHVSACSRESNRSSYIFFFEISDISNWIALLFLFQKLFKLFAESFKT